jgi:chemotaxis response regulator CheB
VKIGIVHGTPREVDTIRRALALDPQHTVVWLAQNASDALALCAQVLPELVLLDLFVPEMGGVELTRRIMAATPCPILLMTADVGADASQIFEAMGCGAFDAIDTPRPDDINRRFVVDPFLFKLDGIHQRLRDRHSALSLSVGRPVLHVTAAHSLIAIGASAGGPAAVRTMLHGLPKDFPAAVVIVQHMDHRFAPGMVEWLSGHSALPIRVGKEGDIPAAGTVLVASTNDHLVLKSASRLGYTSLPADAVYRPSVDVFFHSVCKRWRGRAIGVLLTGMGRDGAFGLKALRDKGHHTMAQDRASSAVYGMPKAAVECGAAVEIVEADQIASKLVHLLSAENQGR